MRGIWIGAVLIAAGCSAGDGLDLIPAIPSVPLFGEQAPPGPAAPGMVELDGLVVSVPLDGWSRNGEQRSDEGHLVNFGRADGGPESLDIQALRTHADTPVERFAGGLQDNIRLVCKDAAIAPLSRRQLGNTPALILRFSCETTARARTNGGLMPFEAGLYAIVPTPKAMVVIQRAWSGAARPDDFPALTLRPDWREFLDGLSVCDPQQGQVCPVLSKVSARQGPAAPPARQTPVPRTG